MMILKSLASFFKLYDNNDVAPLRDILKGRFKYPNGSFRYTFVYSN